MTLPPARFLLARASVLVANAAHRMADGHSWRHPPPHGQSMRPLAPAGRSDVTANPEGKGPELSSESQSYQFANGRGVGLLGAVFATGRGWGLFSSGLWAESSIAPISVHLSYGIKR